MKAIDLKKYSIQFITHQNEKYTYYDSAKIALEGGIRWIQLRMKESSKDTILQEAIRIRNLCKSYQALFFVDDHVDLALASSANGVHLGINDMPIKEARKLAGNNLLIGGTANTFNHIEMQVKEGVDYIGLGPFRYTDTKKHLSPILGLEGIQKIVLQCQKNKISTIIHVIGGIQTMDIKAIMQTGVNGIAISSAILQAENPVEAAHQFVDQLK